MSTIKISFTNEPNKALQVGDIVFYTSTTSSNGFNKNTGETYKIGSVKSVEYSTDNSAWEVVVNTDGTIPTPSDTDYFYFVKNSEANTSGVSGYYAEIKFTNDSLKEAELFSVGSDVVESSK